ncbi:MAG: flippase [Patescibacteria group bacterium]
MIRKIKNLFFFETKTIRGTIFKNFIWLFTGNVGSRLLKAVIVIYAARKLGVEGYGVFSYALGLAGFFVFFKNIGVDSILTREVAKQPEKEHYYFSTAFWIEIVLLVITAFLIIFIAPFFSGVEGAILLLPFVALILIFDDLKDFFVAFFRGKNRMDLEAFVVVAVNIALALFGFIALYFWASPKSFTISNMIASFIGVIVATFLLKPFIRGISKNFSKNLIMPILKSAWPFAIGGFASTFLFNVDIIMLGWWRGVDEIGLYSATQKIVGIFAIFPGFIATATLPSLSLLAHSDPLKIKNVLEGSFKIIFIISFPLVIGGILLSGQIMGFLFGPSYLPATGAFIILLISILAVHIMPILTNLLFIFDKQAKTINYAIIVSICNIALNFLLIPNYGIEGAALATLISFFIYAFLLWQIGKKIYNFKIFSGLIKPVIAALIMGFFTYILEIIGIHIIINIIFSSVLYFFTLYLFKEKVLEEILTIIKR